LNVENSPVPASKTDVLQQLWPEAWTWVVFAVLAGIGGWLLWRIRAHWSDDADDDASPHEMLVQFWESAREGVLTAEEYRLIKSRLTNSSRPVAESERHESTAPAVDSGNGMNAPKRPSSDGGQQP